MPGISSAPQGSVPAASSSDAWHPGWMPRAIGAFVLLNVALLAAYALLPAVESRGALYSGSHVVSVLAFTVGVSTSRRGFRRDWLIMLAGMYVWLACDVIAVVTLDAEGMPMSWAPAVTLSLLAYGLVTVGAFRLARRDGFVRGSAVVLDGAVFLLATLMAWWLLVGQELVAHRSAGTLTPGMIAAGVGPIGDGMLLAAASSLTSSRAAHSLSSRALIGAALAGLLGDFAFARITVGYPLGDGSLIPALWMIQFACAAVAALASGHPAARQRRALTPAVVVLVVGGLVVPPLFTAYAAAIGGDDLHVDGGSLIVLAVGTAATTTLVCVRATMLVRRMERQAADIERTSRTDELTQLPNRRAGVRLLDEAIDLAHGSPGGTLTVALLDLDHFKRFNDTHGHQHGDRLLRAAGRSWMSTLAGRGTVFRYGGEEFVLLLPDTSPVDAHDVLDDLRRATPFDQTFSAGIATLRPGEDATSLVGRADASLYAAKAAGRAQTVEAA